MCSLFGLLDYSGYFNHREKSLILSVLSNECEVRGTDATGIAYNSSGLRIFKRPLPAHTGSFPLPRLFVVQKVPFYPVPVVRRPYPAILSGKPR